MALPTRRAIFALLVNMLLGVWASVTPLGAQTTPAAAGPPIVAPTVAANPAETDRAAAQAAFS